MAAATPERRRDVDGLRAVAIALVVAFHAVPDHLPGGFVGVDVFFVISGFLISRILMADDRPGRFRRFYERRARRLFPALALVLLATLAAGHVLLLAAPFERLARHTVAAALFVANFAFWRDSGYFDAAALEKPLLHLWSLGIEEQFYLVWPALFWWLLRRPGRALRATLALAAASFAATVLVADRSPTAVFYLPWFRFWELLAGAIVAQVPALAGARQRGAGGALLGGGALASIVAGAVWIDPHRPFPSWPALLPVVGTAVLLWGGEQTWLGRRLLAARPVVGLGLISYPLYLWHWPLLSFHDELYPDATAADRAPALLLALLLAIATWAAVERPARSFYRHAPRLATATIAGSLALLAGTAWVLPQVRPRRLDVPPEITFLEAQRELDRTLRASLVPRPCPGSAAPAAALARVCVAGAAGAGAPIVLWGDSTAASWAPLVHALAAERGQPAIVLSVSGCPPLLGVHGPYHDGCDPAAAAARLDYLRGLQPSHVVLTARWGAYVGEPAAGDQSPPHFVSLAPGVPATLGTSVEAVSRQLPETLRAVSAIAPTVVLAAAPDLLHAPFRAVPRGVELRPPLARHRTAQQVVAAAFAGAAAAGLPVTVLDPAELLCADGRCAAVVGATLVYQDDNHVTAQGALLFRDELRAALLRLPR